MRCGKWSEAFVGWAKGAHTPCPPPAISALDGGHASLCPPYTLTSTLFPQERGEESTSHRPQTLLRRILDEGGEIALLQRFLFQERSCRAVEDRTPRLQQTLSALEHGIDELADFVINSGRGLVGIVAFMER